ncbi:hypothetical protein CQ020_07775 [Arthrobacter sp. MYb23]|uniref:hypothetical protein n=1 Tax=unclassified Arthrobacter TaxID=235627 RepID=UPI000CFCC7B4|nr:MULTISPECIES: hypothetical protein [unclassified Arthrobacter]PRB43931.1 hypothetical protein CQ038_06015 [Arthrobacter sp. MYb51]PRB97536.1 hypothetical protein CQ020_07775 [Arthrobacter sp. MYb23]
MTEYEADPTPVPQGPPRYPVDPKSQYEHADRHRFVAPPPLPEPPQTLGTIRRKRYGSPVMAPAGQLALAFAVLAPSWLILQASLMVAYDGLLSMFGLMLASVIVPVVAIVAAITLGLPLRLIPALNRWWAGSGRAYISIAAISAGLIAAGFVKTVRQFGEMDGIPYDALTPDPTLVCGGWFLLALLLVNASLPLRWTNRASS